MNICISNTLPGRDGARELLRQSVRAVWGFGELPAVAHTDLGKPYFSQYPHLHFNLSHSGTYSLCALSAAPVGADIQIVKDSWSPRLPQRVCSPEQLRWLEAQPHRARAFALLWSLKEARVKYEGVGLRYDIRGIRVPLPVPGEVLYRLDGLWFRIYEGEDYWAAVCGEELPPEMKKY